jgi:hypothetical protein
MVAEVPVTLLDVTPLIVGIDNPGRSSSPEAAQTDGAV